MLHPSWTGHPTFVNWERRPIPIQHFPAESAAPPVAYKSASGVNLATLGYSPAPRGLLFTQAGWYSLTPWQTASFAGVSGLVQQIIAYATTGTVMDGSFAKVQYADKTDLISASAVYFFW